MAGVERMAQPIEHENDTNPFENWVCVHFHKSLPVLGTKSTRQDFDLLNLLAAVAASSDKTVPI